MLCEKSKCTGCFACYNICPKNAIKMEEDEYGNVYPKINSNKCINCNLCNNVCPELNEKLSFNESNIAFLLYDKNFNERIKSSSGGAAMLFSKMIIENGGVVYGASNIFGNNRVGFERIDNLNDLYKIRGSKYFHCYVNESFKSIKKDLKEGVNVLFIGTPCQVAGLKMFLIDDYANLITVDIICHGVPSQKLFFENLNEIKRKEDIYYIKFRNEKGFYFQAFDKNCDIVYEIDSYCDYYYYNFLKGNIYRDNCYSCKYAQNKRVSDATIGDFWGASKDSVAYDSENKGLSLALPNTDKGEILINRILDKTIYDIRPLEEAYRGNAQLNHPSAIKKEYFVYKSKYPIYGYKKTMKKMAGFKINIKISIKKKKNIMRIIHFLKKGGKL